MRHILPILALLGLAIGCGEATTEVAPPGPKPETVTDFAAGNFQLYVVEVDDDCLDGALKPVFMPHGGDTPYALQHPTPIPGFDQLPHTYTMTLAEPFAEMGLTMVRDGDGMKVTDAHQEGVLLGLKGAGDCAGDMDFGATVTVKTADSIRMDTTVTFTTFESTTEACPKTAPLPCTVRLEMTGTRIP